MWMLLHATDLARRLDDPWYAVYDASDRNTYAGLVVATENRPQRFQEKRSGLHLHANLMEGQKNVTTRSSRPNTRSCESLGWWRRSSKKEGCGLTLEQSTRPALDGP
ncbi:hypothetical protein BAE44_0021377 [Dichanthelium oligosanthes]|uniref:Uncharacterized protein n=1 Tax=Dichanthelium oligosanthes TaxID=888268 RepID=A0A1E5UXS7_9POAL|nr:hypothetical protein BAE44_0021377 [Dichanthelium oligosanthes]